MEMNEAGRTPSHKFSVNSSHTLLSHTHATTLLMHDGPHESRHAMLCLASASMSLPLLRSCQHLRSACVVYSTISESITFHWQPLFPHSHSYSVFVPNLPLPLPCLLSSPSGGHQSQHEDERIQHLMDLLEELRAFVTAGRTIIQSGPQPQQPVARRALAGRHLLVLVLVRSLTALPDVLCVFSVLPHVSVWLIAVLSSLVFAPCNAQEITLVVWCTLFLSLCPCGNGAFRL